MARGPEPHDQASVQRLVDAVRQPSGADDEAAGMAITRFRAAGVDLYGLGDALSRWYAEQSLESDASRQPGSVVVRCRSKGGRSFLGGSRGLTIVLRQDGPYLAVEVGEAKWSNKAWVAGAGVGVLMMGSGVGIIPLAASAVGAWRQWRLPTQTLDFLRATTPAFTRGPSTTSVQASVFPSTALAALPSPQQRVSTPAPASGSEIELNAASVQQLANVPGLDRAVAADLLAERDRLGGFRSWEQVRGLLTSRIPAHRLAQARPWLTVVAPPKPPNAAIRGRTSGTPARGRLDL